jgi:D-arabinose 1-dehydrogenase-like Zn-dependent alcohol dehydrogenase
VVPGHEGIGVIAGLGDGESNFKVGDRVVFAVAASAPTKS